jgi:conjugative relaxase-like TrwC/TraI family protein
MLIISKPLSADQVRTYHAEEFSNARENDFTSSDRIYGQWHGHLARQWGLSGDVRTEQVVRLAEGCQPISGQPLVRHQTPRAYVNGRGQKVTTMAHRAAWDATFSAPKSVSLTALVGGDERVREAHRESVAAALEWLECHVQARLHGSAAETTRNWVAAVFEHDSARPVRGYAAPQLHTHVVLFNLTQAADGRIRPLQPRELYRSQQYMTALYGSELAARLRALGYVIERGNGGQPAIRGYTPEYLFVSSPRSQQIQEHLARVHWSGPGPMQIAKYRTREAKLERSHLRGAGAPGVTDRRASLALARAYGDQPAHVVQAATARARRIEPLAPRMTAHAAVTLAMNQNLEHHAVVDERAVLRDALRRSMGEVTADAIRADVEQRVAAGEFVALNHKYDVPARAFTTREMLAREPVTRELNPSSKLDQSSQLVQQSMGLGL